MGVFVPDMPTIQEEGSQLKEEEKYEKPHSPPPTSSMLPSTATTTPSHSTPQSLLILSPPIVDISIHLTSTSLTTPVVVLDSSPSTTSPFTSYSFPPHLPTISTLPPSLPTTSMEPLTLPHTFASYLQKFPPQLSKVILNPQVKIIMDQLDITMPVSPPPTKPLKMEATMQIYKEMEMISIKNPKEIVEDIVEEPKELDREDYFKYLEGGIRVDLDEVASNEEGQQKPEGGDASKFSAYYDVETSY